MHLQRLPSLNFVDDGRLRRSATKVGYEGRLRRLNECHATFHTFEISPSKLSNGVFSCVFSSWWRRLSMIRIHFNEISVFSSLFPMLSRIIFAHSWAWVFPDVEVNTAWKIAFLWNNTRLEIWCLILSFSLSTMAAKETTVEKKVIFPNSCFKSVTFKVHSEYTTAEILICRRFCVYMSGSRIGFWKYSMSGCQNFLQKHSWNVLSKILRVLGQFHSKCQAILKINLGFKWRHFLSLCIP